MQLAGWHNKVSHSSSMKQVVEFTAKVGMGGSLKEEKVEGGIRQP